MGCENLNRSKQIETISSTEYDFCKGKWRSIGHWRCKNWELYMTRNHFSPILLLKLLFIVPERWWVLCLTEKYMWRGIISVRNVLLCFQLVFIASININNKHKEHGKMPSSLNLDSSEGGGKSRVETSYQTRNI